MKSEKAKQLAENAIQNLIGALEAGKSEALTAYLSTMAKFHHYSFRNCMLIGMQRPDATRVAGFRTWKKLNRYVKKGEKGIVIIAPMVIRKDAEGGNGEEPLVLFKAAYVFDVSQTDGETLPEPSVVTGNPNGHTERLRSFASSHSIEIEYSDALGSALGVSTGGKILLLKDLSPAEEFATLSHEVAHEMLHKDAAHRSTSKKVRETEAEAVSFVVCQAIGLDTNTAAADYIQLYEGDKDTLFSSLDRIQQTASTIIEAIEEVE